MATKKGFTPFKKVTSHALNALAYHEDDQCLLVRYDGGSDWYYDNVPKHVYKELLMADKNERASVGKLFLSMVKNNPDRPGRRVE